MKIEKNSSKMEIPLRREELNIVPYARSASHAFKTKGLLRKWDNGWDNCWHNGDWVDAPHPWQNIQQYNKTENNGNWWNNTTKYSIEKPAKLSDAIFVREDGFIHNKINEIVFYADTYALKVINEILDKPAVELMQTHKNVLKQLWLD